MRIIDPVLGKALVLSLALHAILLAAGDWLDRPARQARGPLEWRLDVALLSNEAFDDLQARTVPDESLQTGVRPPAAAQQARALSAHAPAHANVSRPGVASAAGMAPADEAMRQAGARLARELPYPAEAIARGLEGEVLVLLFLDASGNPVAARLESSSGHALLDDAALRAARTLRALPQSVPREALLPVRFRLY